MPVVRRVNIHEKQKAVFLPLPAWFVTQSTVRVNSALACAEANAQNQGSKQGQQRNQLLRGKFVSQTSVFEIYLTLLLVDIPH